MRRLSVALLALGTAFALAACADERGSTAPRSIAAGSDPSAVVLPASCVPNDISQNAKQYFANNDAVFDLISVMKADLRTSTTKATPSGFAVLSRTAAVRDSALQTGTSVQGAAFVNAVVGCMSVGTIPTSFNAAKALAYGVFEVRTGGVNEGATVAYSAANAGSTTAASPEFGAEAASPSNAPVWPSASGMGSNNRYLVYGYPLGTNNDVVTDGFEMGTVPASNAASGPSVEIADNPLAIGICVSSTVLEQDGSRTARLLFHDNSEYLSLQKLNFCSQSVAVVQPGGWLRTLPSRLLAFVKPTTLFAQDETRDFIGGLPSGWSPNVPTGFLNTAITLTFDRQPVDAKLRKGLDTVVVKAVTTDALDAPLPLNIRLTIANNSGSPAYLTLKAGGDAMPYIDTPLVIQPDTKTGFATIIFGFTKAGGYTLTATGYIGGGGVSTAGVISNLFNVKNQ